MYFYTFSTTVYKLNTLEKIVWERSILTGTNTKVAGFRGGLRVPKGQKYAVMVETLDFSLAKVCPNNKYESKTLSMVLMHYGGRTLNRPVPSNDVFTASIDWLGVV